MKRGFHSDIPDGDGIDSDDDTSARADFDYEDEVAQASAVLALRLEPEHGRSVDKPESHSVSADKHEERLTRERNRLHAKSTRERKKQRLTHLQQRAKALETEIDELLIRGGTISHPDGATLHGASGRMGEGMPPSLTMADLQARAGKLSMRVQAQDLMLNQLQRDNAILMAQLNSQPPNHQHSLPDSGLAGPQDSSQIPRLTSQRQFFNPNAGIGGFSVAWPGPAMRHDTPELNRLGDGTQSASEHTRTQQSSS